MDKQQFLDKTAEALRPFETANLMTTVQNLTLKQIFTHPAVLLCIAVVFFYGVIKKSKIVLLTLFALIGMIVILRYAMPAPGEQLSVKSLIPFVCGGLVIGGVIIYFSLIKSD
ncbi:MAG TPA: hypothetical protein VIH45_05305 [Desulfuromonadaceae bacterium]